MIDYIALARKAEIDVLTVESERASMWPATPECLEKFAELLLAADRENLRRLIADDGHASTFQTIGQYRSALLAALANTGDQR